MIGYNLISNRGPNFSCGGRLHRAAGGSADAYRLLMEKACRTWTCLCSNEICQPNQAILSEYGERLNVVGLEKQLYHNYYFRFISECLHPLLLDWPDKVSSTVCEEALHQATEQVANSVLKLNPFGFYIIGDYHLYQLPRLLRGAQHIVLFWFIPFLEYSLDNKIIQDIILALSLADDLVFLHEKYANNYRSCYKRLTGKEAPVRLHANTLGAHAYFAEPCLDDIDSFRCIVEKNFGLQNIQDKRLLLSVCRLDFAKSVPTLLAAFQKFIEVGEHGDVDLLLALPPHRPDSLLYVEEEKIIRSLLSPLLASGRVHVAWDWMSRKEMQVLYKFADAFVIPSRHDGMPLTAFEYALANKGDGRLIVSDGIGAHFIMQPNAFSFAKDDSNALAYEIQQAFNTPLFERLARMKQLKANAQAVNINPWYKKVLSILKNNTSAEKLIPSDSMFYLNLNAQSIHNACKSGER